jgi:hypothetical protein
MAMLHRAAEQGYLKDSRALADDTFAPLRSRDDFQALLRRLQGAK